MPESAAPLPDNTEQLRALCAQLRGQLAQQNALVERLSAQNASLDKTLRARQQTIDYLQEKLALLLIQTPHHHAAPSPLTSTRRNHCSHAISTGVLQHNRP